MRSTPGTSPPGWHWRSGPVAGARCVVCDIDGVISDAAARQRFLARQPPDWTAFFEACGEDPLVDEMAKLLDLLEPTLVVVLLTARPLSVKRQTIEWLDRFGVRHDLLIMRPQGVREPARSFKRRAIRQLCERGFDLVLGFEDDPSNRSMFEAEGVPCVYVHSGYYE
ncbi:MAG: hypothetical protein ACRDVP_11315 [Acidimicrobiales bacterium]